MGFKYEIWIEIWNRNSRVEFEHGIEFEIQVEIWIWDFKIEFEINLENRIFRVKLEREFQIGFQNGKSKWFWNGIWIQGNLNGFEWRNSNSEKNEFED